MTSEKLPKSATIVLYSRLLRDYVTHYKGRLFLAIFFMIISALTATATAFVMKPIIDEVFFDKNPEYVIYTTLAVVCIFAARGFATYGQTIVMDWVGTYRKTFSKSWFLRISPGFTITHREA